MNAANVFEFDQPRRAAEIANQNAVKAACDKFASLAQQFGCRRVFIAAHAPDGTHFQVYSHDIVDGTPGVDFVVVPPKHQK